LLPVRDCSDGDVDDESDTGSQTTNEDDSNPARSGVKESESLVTEASTRLDVSESVGVFNLCID
jgi:hypothetical protein